MQLKEPSEVVHSLFETIWSVIHYVTIQTKNKINCYDLLGVVLSLLNTSRLFKAGPGATEVCKKIIQVDLALLHVFLLAFWRLPTHPGFKRNMYIKLYIKILCTFANVTVTTTVSTDSRNRHCIFPEWEQRWVVLQPGNSWWHRNWTSTYNED